jgi:Family of unknown function (DUF6339)
MTELLRYLTTAHMDRLRRDSAAAASKYMSSDFAPLQDLESVTRKMTTQMDTEVLERLDAAGGPDVEVRNSILVHSALPGLSAAAASDVRIWAYLAHGPALAYARKRWLKGKDGDKLAKAVAAHFFGSGIAGYRDDNAVGRLWWNAHIASTVSDMGVEDALHLLLKTADIRQAIIERPGIASRPALLAGIVHYMRRDPSVHSDEKKFRSFMININKFGGGMIFEAMDDGDLNEFLGRAATE